MTKKEYAIFLLIEISEQLNWLLAPTKAKQEELHATALKIKKFLNPEK
jgi:hypothetical protein